MLLSLRLPLSSLIDLCRTLRHYLSSGLTLRDVFRQESQRGHGALRPVAGRIYQLLEGGEDLEKALKQEQAAFPPLFVALVTVGEQTGNLPEVCRELEQYFLLQKRLRGLFLSQIAWPVLQFNMAVFVIAFLLWAMGFVAEMTSSKPIDPLGLGLVGGTGALVWLFLVYGTVAALFGLYLAATRVLRQKAVVDAYLLRVPVVGGCVRALAMTRFCLALGLTQQTSMSVRQAVRLSLRASGNEAFVARTDVVLDALRRGEDLTVALAESRVFPVEFIHIVEVAEESGRLAEEMQRQSVHYQEESARRMTALTILASFAVWLFVAVLIIIAIFRIAMVYLNAIDPANYGL
jgi:type IV pilus assembly protein PilC